MRRLAKYSIQAVGVLAIAALALAACGDDSDDAGSDDGTTTTEAETPAASAAGAAVVKVVDNDEYGKILADESGKTVYVFLKDTGTTSTCTDACADLWPPVTVTGEPTGDGVDAAFLGTTTRPDGTMQLTVGGHPVYTYTPDAAAGDTTGEGVGDVWFVVDPSGGAVKEATASTDTSETTVESNSGY